MLRRVLTALAIGTAAILVAVSPARADGTIYIVTGPGDAPGAGCSDYVGLPGAFACDSLRAAVAAAAANPGLDVVGLGTSGTFTLTQGPLLLDADISIAGPNARTTTIKGNGSSRVVIVGAGVTAGLSGVTIAGGRAGTGDGGNILNAGSLVLTNARVTGGTAANGGGIANTGTFYAAAALIDGNSATGQGGAVMNLGDGATAALTAISETTIFGNTAASAGGISSAGNSSNQLFLTHVTMGFNTSSVPPGGISVAPGSTWSSSGSLLIGNTGNAAPSNCDLEASAGSTGIEDATGCGMQTSTITGLASSLSNDGGQTDILAIPSFGPAKGTSSPCNSGSDQRSAPRSGSGACDMGAYKQGAVAPPVTGFELPPITTQPPPIPPAPSPTPTPVATPEPQKSVAGQVVEGKIRLKKPGSKTFVDLDPSQPIPVGSTIDATDGTITVTALLKKGGKSDKANFYDGIFKVTQSKTTTDLTLNEALAACKKGRASTAAKKPKSRKLWGDGAGSFRTRGQYSAATVRGTRWLVQDSCSGTLTKVSKGAVTVRDQVKRKTIVLRAGKQYLARPKK